MELKKPEFIEDAKSYSEWVINLRRKFHECPELKYEEYETSSIIRDTLDALKIKWQHPVAKTGVVGIIGSGKEPCVAIRADMDALPVLEENQTSYKSKNHGLMHACGHDCHMAMLLGAARLLKLREAELNGTVKLIFQPAEEGGAGAKVMCEEGALENPKVSKIFAMHVTPGLPSGVIAGNSSTILAGLDLFEVEIVGKSCHGAYPHQGIDPIVVAAKIINEIQTIVSREINPFESAVVTVGSIHAGTAANIIPEKVTLTGTIRSFSMDSLDYIKNRFKTIVEMISKANQCTANIKYLLPGFPPTFNDHETWEQVKIITEKLIGKENVRLLKPAMGGEDFAYYQQKIPGCLVFLGVAPTNTKEFYGLHHSKFQVDENALYIGSSWYASVAFKMLASG